jgi:RHS repeat-associated protein
VISYKYDGLGRRIEKNVDGKITRYVYDNEDIILEYDGEGNLIAEYIHGPGIDEPLMMKRDNQTYYYIADALGSIRALVDTQGFIRQMYEYNAFGEIVQVLDEEGAPIPIEDAIPNPYTFTDREYDPETGLYYYRARYYDPRLGRFLQEDPFKGFLDIPHSLNLYLYAYNNPIKYIDPWGLICHGPGVTPPGHPVMITERGPGKWGFLPPIYGEAVHPEAIQLVRMYRLLERLRERLDEVKSKGCTPEK